jgi:hypothetical protein
MSGPHGGPRTPIGCGGQDDVQKREFLRRRGGDFSDRTQSQLHFLPCTSNFANRVSSHHFAIDLHSPNGNRIAWGTPVSATLLLTSAVTARSLRHWTGETISPSYPRSPSTTILHTEHPLLRNGPSCRPVVVLARLLECSLFLYQLWAMLCCRL